MVCMGGEITMSNKFTKYILLLIILIATILRFWRLWDMPFMHDELSMLSRLGYDSWAKLIAEGIKPDGHPAGVQVFMYIWTKFFGTAEWVVKLPFLCMGVAAVYYVYRVGKIWFDDFAGLMAAAFLATLQYSVMYSQIARPYSSGLFLSVLMVYFWSKYLLESPQNQRFLYFFIFAAALNTYNHHFSLLLAGIVWLSGWLFVLAENRKKYLLSGFAIAVLYLPHLPIFFAQLHTKGLGWVAAPSPRFVIDFLCYIFHFEWINYIWTLILFSVQIGILFYKKAFIWQKNRTFMLRLLAIIWAILPLIIGYFYSIYRAPVLQMSMLLFSFPYFLLFLFSFGKKISQTFSLFLLAISLIINIYTLVEKRQHYLHFYKQPYQEISKNAIFYENKFPQQTTFITSAYPFFLNYYLHQQNHAPHFQYLQDSLSEYGKFRQYLENQTNKYLFLGYIAPEYVQIAQEVFPFVVKKEAGFTYDWYLLSKDATYFSQTEKPIYEIHQNLEKVETLGTDKEWSESISVSLTDTKTSIYENLQASVFIQRTEKDADALLILELWRGNERILWQSAKVSDFAPKLNEWQKVYLSHRLIHTFDRKEKMENVICKIYVWNNSHKTILSKQLSLRLSKGSPAIYALFQQVRE